MGALVCMFTLLAPRHSGRVSAMQLQLPLLPRWHRLCSLIYQIAMIE
jgi:hypothetical protein